MKASKKKTEINVKTVNLNPMGSHNPRIVSGVFSEIMKATS